jgi:hypothetical protein
LGINEEKLEDSEDTQAPTGRAGRMKMLGYQEGRLAERLEDNPVAMYAEVMKQLRRPASRK